MTPAGPDYIALDGLVRLRGCTLGLVVTESTDEVQKDMHRRFYKELTVRPGGSRKLLHRELIHMGARERRCCRAGRRRWDEDDARIG